MAFSRWHRVVLLSVVLLTFGCCVSADTSDSGENEFIEGSSSDQSDRNESIEETNSVEFPWSVAVFQVVSVGGVEMDMFICAAALVDRGTVLTTADCVQQKSTSTLKVHLGQWDGGQLNESSGKVLKVENAKIHHQYHIHSKQNNLALLTLDDNVDFGPSMNRVCLAEAEVQYDSDHHCYMVGWGKSINDDKYKLLKLNAYQIGHQECQERLRNLKEYHKAYQLVAEAVCTLPLDPITANYPCSPVVGSALVCTKGTASDPFYLVGVASQLPRNCSLTDPTIPDVFMDVEKYIKWINQDGNETCDE